MTQTNKLIDETIEKYKKMRSDWAPDDYDRIIDDLQAIKQSLSESKEVEIPKFKSFAIWVVKDVDTFKDTFEDYENLQYPFVYCLWEDTQENRDAQVDSL